MKCNRILSLMLALVMLLAMIPVPQAEATSSSSQIYYPIDFSAAVLKSKVVSRNGKDCALVSIATTEAYLYGATSTADRDKVYNAVINKNLGSTSGKPNPLGVESWANLGYNKRSYSLQNLYNELEKGYPVLIHKTNGKGSEHWSVVCGYKGSTTKLQKSGFIVVDIESDRGKYTLDDWQGSMTLDEIAYRKNGLPITNLSGGVRIAVNVPEVVHPTGEGNGVYGYAVSSTTLTAVQIRIINAKNGNLIYDKTVNPNAKSYQVFKQDANIKFADLPAGSYYYTVYAKDSAGSSKIVVKYFIVDTKWPTTQPAEPVYTIQYNGNGGTGSADSVTLKFLNGNFTLPQNPYSRPGYKFLGWSVQRTPDKRWYVMEVAGWLTESEMAAKGYDARIYEEGYSTNIGWPWIKNCGSLSPTFTFYAQWEPLCVNGHDYTEKTVNPTCTEKGYTTYTCSKCGDSYIGKEVPAGHQEVTDKAVAATCTKDGLTEGKHCSVCGTVTVKQEAVKAKGHSFANGTCTVCGAADSNYVAPVTSTVSRVYGTDRYQTAFKAADELKKVLGVSKFQNIIVACGTNFPDALSGTYLAAQKNAPILLVKGNNVAELNEYIQKNLASGGTLYLLGDDGVVSQNVGKGISGITIKRLGGATRYDTNLLILKEAGVGSKDIIICTGKNFADSLSASAVGLPILLVKDGLTASQKDFLKSVSGDFIIVGGSNAVNATIEKQLVSYGNVKRLAGATRYDTSVMVAKEFFSTPAYAVLAYAQNFPDGLSGGPLAYNLNAPLILTDSGKSAAAVKYTTGLAIKRGYVLGGTGLISDKVVKQVFSMAADDIIAAK